VSVFNGSVPRVVTLGTPIPGQPVVPEDIQEQMRRRPIGPRNDIPGMQQTIIQRSLSVFPPDVVPPRTSVQFQPFAQLTTNAVGQDLLLWEFLVPPSSVLVIKSLDLYVNTVVPATDLHFGIFVDGVPYQGYGDIPIFPIPSAGYAKSFNEQTWRFPEAKTVSCRVRNVDGGTHLVGSGAQGWYYNKAIDDLFNAGF